MKAKEITDLISFIAQSPLDEVNIETDDFKISVKRHSGVVKSETLPQVLQPAQTVSAQQIAPKQEAITSPEKDAKEAGGNYVTIKSPMIGTFYRSAKPEQPSFVNVGDEVTKGQVVCIIEAMKLFNEIESEVSGRIVKVLVENASPTEYDQPLFLVEPM